LLDEENRGLSPFSVYIGMECHPCYQWLLKLVSPYLAAWPAVDVDVKQKFQFGGIGALFGYEIDILVTPDPLYRTGLHFEPCSTTNRCWASARSIRCATQHT
jgi:LysR family transcriptional regulator for metE and metH